METNDIAISVRDLNKSFKIYYDKNHSIKEALMHFGRGKSERRKVINGISFDIKKGEAVGLVGHNGCGKSTTLKLLTRIMYPNSGKIEINGRVSSLLELGAGFHPDLTGRENIYTNASIFGLTKKEIDARMGSIIDFSELGDFIDNPVRTYSSGMYMRLAFSVAINVKADILLIDEILAVGDVNFQTKCFNKLYELKNQGVTIVLVSHSMDQVEMICDRSIWIHEGVVRMDDTPREVRRAYLKYMDLQRKSESGKKELTDDLADRRGTGEARITKIDCLDKNGNEFKKAEMGDDVTFRIYYKSKEKLDKVCFGLAIDRIDGVRCCAKNTRSDDIPPFAIKEKGYVDIVFPKLNLLRGRYTIDATIEQPNCDTIDYIDKANSFEIMCDDRIVGVSFMEHEWRY